MARPQAKSFRNPEEVRRFPNGRIEAVSYGETAIGRFWLEPGWRWSRDVGPIAHTHSCQIHHQGVVLRGRLHVESDAGEVCEVGSTTSMTLRLVTTLGWSATSLSRQSSSSARASMRYRPMEIACSRRCYAPISWTRPRISGAWEIRRGASCCSSITGRCGKSSIVFEGARFRPPATDSWRRSTVPRARCDARGRLAFGRASWDCDSGRGSYRRGGVRGRQCTRARGA